MCGFTGIYGEKSTLHEIKLSLNSINYRGPDNTDFFISDEINLGFARLSIQDQSSKANQPIMHPNKKFIMVFNGELYNHKELRKYIKSNRNKNLLKESTGDTFTLLALIDELGIEQTLKKIQGMFAIAIYFFDEKRIYLIRDHFGQKPLFYKRENNKVLFASAIKAIDILSNQKLEIDRNSILLPFLQSHISSDSKTIFKNIESVNPGELIIFSDNNYYRKIKYFKTSDLISEDLNSELNKSNINEISIRLGIHLNESIKSHLITDAPIGTLFSAGLDSSIIAKLAEKNGSPFRIGFNSNNKIDSNFYEMFDKLSDFDTVFYKGDEGLEIANLPKILNVYETINKPDGTILSSLTKIAKDNGVKSLLSGDASDEIFSGYNYFSEFYDDISGTSFEKTNIARKIINKLFPSITNFKYQDNSWMLYHNFLPNDMALLEPYLDILQYKESRLKSWMELSKKCEFAKSKKESLMMAFTIDEIQTRLPRYLMRADAYGMINSIEMRTPFLDMDIVKFAINTPTRFKISRFRRLQDLSYTNKLMLKKAAENIQIPNKLIFRKKIGTNFDIFHKIIKLINSISLSSVADMLSISEENLKNSILYRYNLNKYPRHVLNRFAYNTLSLQILFDIFEGKINPELISDNFLEILKKK